VSSYTGPTVINGGMIVVRSLDIGGFSSSIGSSSNAASNLVLNHGGIRYNGSTIIVSDRSFTLGAGENAGMIIADGTRIQANIKLGLTGLSPAVAFQDPGARTLTLAGSNRGDNTFNLVLGDGQADANGLFETSLAKIGNGTWVLSRTNSYSGETKVLAGVLAATADGAFGASGGAGVVIGGGTNGSQALGNLNATVDLRNVNYTVRDHQAWGWHSCS
jgi:autotransporter-associated beta strand protein